MWSKLRSDTILHPGSSLYITEPITSSQLGEGWNSTTPIVWKRGLLKHILNSCSRALGDGRYRWCHNQVLRVIARVFDKCLRTSTYKPISRRINFAKAGGNIQSAVSEKTSLLRTPLDWELFFIWISSWNSLIILFEHNFGQTWFLFRMWRSKLSCGSWRYRGRKTWQSHERKLAKYQELVELCRRKGWWTHCDPIEIGCRGFMGQSLCKALNKSGLAGRNKRTSIRWITDAAEGPLDGCGLRERVVGSLTFQ